MLRGMSTPEARRVPGRDRPIVLVPCDYYLPGFRAGGPIQTIAGVLENLKDEFKFKVITRDRDIGDQHPYPRVTVNEWQTLGPSEVMYLSPSRLNPLAIWRLISDSDHDLLNLNSCFSVPFAILPLTLRRLGLIPRRPVIIGPRGELAPGALAFKSFRKRLYLAAARLLGLTRGVVWQASGQHEARDIQRCFGNRVRVTIASDLATLREPAGTPRADKHQGGLRMLFLSRISRMKNLDGALSFLRGVTDPVQFAIYGPIEDAEYWRSCQELIAVLPSNVTVSYNGPVSPEHIGEVMAQHDLLLLPTLGEAFGHVILEAMVGGCPVLISDRTRWRGLEAAGVGWDLPLAEPKRFRDVIHSCVEMDSATWREMSERARRYGLQALNNVEAREQNRELFRSVYRRTEQPLGTTGQIG